VKAAATSIQIRKASEADATSIASILRQAFAEFEPLYTKRGYAATVLGTDAILTRMKEGPVWISICKGRAVGTAAAVSKQTGLYLRGMAAIPGARGFGVGRMLLQEAETFANDCGTYRLFLSTTPFLIRAIQLYQQFGFQRTNEGPHDLFGTPLFTMEKILTASACVKPSDTRSG
jgi:N-acetylglutamate synthase-like GNAT family acetyltransferase